MPSQSSLLRSPGKSWVHPIQVTSNQVPQYNSWHMSPKSSMLTVPEMAAPFSVITRLACAEDVLPPMAVHFLNIEDATPSPQDLIWNALQPEEIFNAAAEWRSLIDPAPHSPDRISLRKLILYIILLFFSEEYDIVSDDFILLLLSALN